MPTNRKPSPNPLVSALPATIPFIGPERLERECGAPFIARLGANESNHGCSPRAIEAMAKAAVDDVWKYSDPEVHDLRTALAAFYGLGSENVVVGHGIDGLLGLIVRIYSDLGDAIITSHGAYPTFNYHVAGYGRKLELVPYRKDSEDIEALAETARRTGAKIVYFSNPDNPMGTWWSAADVTRFMDALPEECLLILDEAYGELAPEGTLPGIDITRKNVLYLRTFSKAYGLAGLRCGYAIGAAELIAPFDKVRDHFAVNVMAQKACLAALGDQEWLTDSVAKTVATRARITAIARANGLTPLPSATNFVTIDCGRDGAFALRVLEALRARQVFIRKPMAPVLDRCIRVSAGLPEEIAVFDAALAGALQDAAA